MKDYNIRHTEKKASGKNLNTLFFESIFPQRSLVELRFLKNGKAEQKWISTHQPAEILRLARTYTKNGWNCYFGVAARKRKGGKKEDLDYVNTVWIDLDTDKNGLDKNEVLQRLKEWIFPPSVVVDSGHGLHCYWLLREPTNEFKKIEQINLSLAKTLKGDTVARDATRILRIPGTLNFKDRSNPAVVRIVHFNPEIQYTLLDLEELGVSEERRRHLPEEEAFDKSQQLSFESKFSEEVIDTVINECAFLKYCRDNAERLDEPSWYAMITNLAALGAIDKIHELSKPYHKPPKRYTFKETQEKIEHAIKDAPGPHTCSYIQKELQFNCGTCPWKEKVKAPAGIAYKLTKSNEFPFSVLGYTLKNEIIFWYKGNIFTMKTRDLTRENLMLFFKSLDRKSYQIIKESILRQAAEKDFVDTENTLKMGIWKTERGFLIISGKDVLHIEGDRIQRIHEPVWNGKIITLGEKWLDPDYLEHELKTADITRTYTELRELIAQWNFADREMLNHITAFVMLAPFQQAMKWRPWIYLTGRRGTGKTTFLDEILGIYDVLTVRMDKTTAHALAQTVGNTGKIPVLDEFEQYKRMEEILEVAKLSSKGGYYTRGTTGDKAKKWHFHHIFWFASIYVAGTDAAQKSRMIVFELLPHTEKNPSLPTSSEKELLLHSIVASVIKNWEKIEEKAEEYRRRKRDYKVKDGRIVDNFAYSAALIDVAIGEGEIPEFAETVDFAEDEEEILRTILNTVVNDRTVYDWLTYGNEAAEKFGVKKITKKDGSVHLVIEPKRVRRYLLKDTMWKDLNIAEPLLRLAPSRQKEATWIYGKTQRAILIPWEVVLSIVEDGLEQLDS